MSVRANPKIIGAFVVGAVILAVSGVLVFGTGKFLTKKNFFVLYFDGSVSGLDIGAPVEYRGVKVGTVKDIRLYLGSEEEDIRIPVTIQIIPVSLAGADVDREKYRELMIRRGLRAQLQSQSFVTGKLKIAFEYHPDTPVKLSGIHSEYPELPTIPSTIELWSRKVENLPIEELMDDALEAIKGIKTLVNSPELMESVGALSLTMKDVQELAQDVSGQVSPLVANIKEATEAALATIERMSNKLDNLPVEELFENILKAIQGIDRIVNAPEVMESIDSLNQTLKDVKKIVHEDSPLQYELTNVLKELSSAARSLRVAAEYLEQHPEALLYGKGGQKGK
jgi:paraquat-inducible protein B